MGRQEIKTNIAKLIKDAGTQIRRDLLAIMQLPSAGTEKNVSTLLAEIDRFRPYLTLSEATWRADVSAESQGMLARHSSLSRSPSE